MYVKFKNGDFCRFSDEESARDWLNDNVERSMIDPNYRNVPKDIYKY
jgi:hypothetical protein